MESPGDLDVESSEFFITGGSLLATSGGNTTGAQFIGQNVSPAGTLVKGVSLSGHVVVGILLEGSVGVSVDGVTLEVSRPGLMEGIAVVHGISHASPLITLTNATLTLSNYNITTSSYVAPIDIVPQVTTNDISIISTTILVKNLIIDSPSTIALYIATGGAVTLTATTLTVQHVTNPVVSEDSYGIYIVGQSMTVPASGTSNTT